MSSLGQEHSMKASFSGTRRLHKELHVDLTGLRTKANSIYCCSVSGKSKSDLESFPLWRKGVNRLVHIDGVSCVEGYVKECERAC